MVFERRAVALRQADRAAPVGHVRREERGLGARVELEALARQNDLRGDPVISQWLRLLDGVEGDWTQRQTAWRASVLSGSEKSRRSYARSRSTRTVAAPDVAAHFSVRAQVQAMLDVEAALAESQAACGMVPDECVAPIRAAATAE